MKYEVILTMPAIVKVVVVVEASSQDEAIASGYDNALSATPETVQVVSVNNQASMFDSCASCSASSSAEPIDQPASPYGAARYLVQYFETPSSFEACKPANLVEVSDYAKAVALCQSLKTEKNDFARRVVDGFGNKLFTLQNDVGGFALVVFASDTAYTQRSYTVWKGWLGSEKEAKKEALKLLDGGQFFATGVLNATTQPVRITTTFTARESR